MSKIIEVSKIFKSYGKKKVLEDVSFSLKAGKFITLIGCNGAGKSTTLRQLAGMEVPEEGEIKVLGEDPGSYAFKHRSDIFFIHEGIQLNLNMNLLEMVKIYRSQFPRWSNKIFNQLIKARKFSIKKQFSDLSRGQKMQFMMMMAFAARPKIMLLDEVTSVIDIEGQQYFLDLLKQYTVDGGTVVITTNILSELNDYTDHLLLLQETEVLVDAPVEELKEGFCILKKEFEHKIFSHSEVARIRKQSKGTELYLVPTKLIQDDPVLLKLKSDEEARLDDILVFHFNLKKEASDDEQLVA